MSAGPAEPSDRTRQVRILADTPATLHAYAAGKRHFGRWCHKRGQDPFDSSRPLETIIGDYLADIHVAHATSTLQRRIVTTSKQARLNQAPFKTKHPNVRGMLCDATSAGTHELRQTATLTMLDTQRLVDACDTDLSGVPLTSSSQSVLPKHCPARN